VIDLERSVWRFVSVVRYPGRFSLAEDLLRREIFFGPPQIKQRQKRASSVAAGDAFF
jgi:hypothetical protein